MGTLVRIKHSLFIKMTSVERKFKLPQRYGTPGPNIWLEMLALRDKYKPVDLGVGFPDYAPPKYVTKALEEVAQNDNYLLHQYTNGFGHPRLVNILCKLYSSLINREIDANNEMLITEGAQQALYTTFNAFLDAGDEIIVIEPYFFTYLAKIRETGAVMKFIPLKHILTNSDVQTTEDFYLDKNELESLFNYKTKAILLNTPNNPIGKVFNMEEMKMIAELCKKWNVICIADEVYEWMVYKPNEHIRMATLPGMWERTVTICSAGKTFGITGWRVGWAYGPAALMRNLQAVHQNCIYTVLTPIQEAIAMAYEREYETMMNNPEESYFLNLVDKLTTKRDLLMQGCISVGLKPIQPQGGFMIFVDVSSLGQTVDLSRETDAHKDYCMAKWMTKQGLMGFPASAFYSQQHGHLAENFLRFCFNKQVDKLQQATEVLSKLK